MVSPSKAPSAACATECAAEEAVSRAGYGFGPALRLHKTDEFSSVFAFRRVVRGKYFALHYCPNADKTPCGARLGLVVAKKLAKRAVLRNLVKRIGRDVFRHLQPELPHLDLVLRLSAPVATVTKQMMRADMVALFGRLPK